jgi:hypothetical protein
VKNILTSLALWTAIVYQTVDAAPSVAGVRDASGAVFATPSAFAETSSATVLAPVATPVQVEAASVSVVSMLGAITLNEIAKKMPDDPPAEPPAPPPPKPIPINQGEPGPAGGFLLGTVEGTTDWIEAAPQDIGKFLMRDGGAENACKEYSVTTAGGTKIGGWELPDLGALLTIYELYKAGMIDNCDGEAMYWSSTQPPNSTYYYSVNFENGDYLAAYPGTNYLVRPVRLVSEKEIIAFKQAQLEKLVVVF